MRREETNTSAFVDSMDTVFLWSLNAVVMKHPNVSAAKTLSVNANIVLARDRNVFILPYTEQEEDGDLCGG